MYQGELQVGKNGERLKLYERLVIGTSCLAVYQSASRFWNGNGMLEFSQTAMNDFQPCKILYLTAYRAGNTWRLTCYI